jgi:hypothetical protein
MAKGFSDFVLWLNNAARDKAPLKLIFGRRRFQQ